MAREIKTKPLLPSMVECKHCKNNGIRAFTEISTYCPPDGYLYAFRHWCDTGGYDHEWIEVKRYCHGYVGPTLAGVMHDTPQGAIDEWNNLNYKFTSKSFLAKLLGIKD